MGGSMSDPNGDKSARKANMANLADIKALYLGRDTPGAGASPGESFHGGMHTKRESDARRATAATTGTTGGTHEPGLLDFVAGKYGEALTSIEGVGKGARMDALSRERQQVGSAQQQLAGSGLWGSTVGPNLQRGIHSDTMRSLANIDAQVAQLKSGLFTGHAGLQSNNIGNLASILGGVQYKGSNFTGDLLSAAALGAAL